MINGIKCVHLATSYPVEIPLNYKEMQLAMDNGDNCNSSWDIMCDMVKERTGIEIQDQLELQTIIVGGKERPLH